MSFILDALRKSEHERQRHAGPSLVTAPGRARAARTPWIFMGLGFLLALNLAGLVAFWIWRDAREATPVAPAREPPQPGVVPVDPAGTAPTKERLIRPLTDEAIDTGPELPPAAAPSAPEPELLPEAPRAPTTTSPATTPAAQARIAHVTSSDPAGVPALAELDPSVTAGLPVLNLDLHVYLPEASRRFVFINGTRYAEGAALKEGPTVERITRDGAVLSYRGVRFLLQRP